MANTSERTTASQSGGLIVAALILGVVYGLVNLDKLLAAVGTITGGESKQVVAPTKTMSFSDGQTTLEMYWSNDQLHYRVKHQIAPQQFEKRAEDSRTALQPLGMEFALQNRFGEELIRIEIPKSAFRRDEEDTSRVKACGSVAAHEAEYLDFLGAWKATCQSRFGD